LYSGVTRSRPAAAAIFSLSSATGAGRPASFSTSPLYSGMSAIDAISTESSAGASAAAARSSAEL
jgi:hypothetical protein